MRAKANPLVVPTFVLAAASVSWLAGCEGSQATPPATPPRAGVLADAAVAPPAVTAAPPAPRRAPVVVGIVVDQLSAWITSSRIAELPKDGGFARLVREGTWAKAMRYPYAVTDTAPGHAALQTGTVPAESGIFANEIPDEKGDRVSVLLDDRTLLVGPEGGMARAGSSARPLRTPTVADRLRAASPGALVVSVSLKDRGAILPAGKKPSHVLWYDAKSGAFVTSTAFTDTYPAWATSLGSAKANEERRRAPWTPLDAAWVAAHAQTPDDGPGEGDFEGFGRTFPHTAKTPGAFRMTPASDVALVDLALAALDARHDPAQPTLLLVSFSAHDIMSHVFGPDSWEEWDYLRRLDATLARLIDGVEKRVGPASFLLSADHGDVSMPEAKAARKAICEAQAKHTPDPWERPCEGGRRLSSDALRDELRGDTAKALPGGPWIAGVADPYVHLTAAARALPEAKRAVLDKAIRARLDRSKDAIEQVFDVRALQKDCPAKLGAAAGVPARARAGEDTLTLVCRSWSPAIGAGDYYVVPRSGSFFDADYTPGFGTSHGTPHLYDRTIPLFVRARGVVDEGRVVDDPVDFSAYAAVESALLGLDPRSPTAILDGLRAPASPPR
jgi:hypothetical protein